MKLMGNSECANCDRRGRDNDVWYSPFECPAFQLYQVDVITTLQEMGEQPLTVDSLVLIMLKSADRWDQVATFVALTMHRKMKIALEWHRRSVTAEQFPLLVFAISNLTMEEDNPGWSTSDTYGSH